MSDNSISIVSKISDYPANRLKAQQILDWLISEDIVERELSTCVLSSELGYAIAKGASLITDMPQNLPMNLAVNGLEIIVKRTVFDTGGNGVESIICPKCSKDIVENDWDLESWSNSEIDKLLCPQCEALSDINQYCFVPDWGFSNLGFKFWNWPELSPEFIANFEKRLECKVRVVYQRI
ncbi:hypothetical protein [Hymenobacter arizonensis]|uniref:Uncharacterized protein n=1 Tax=Hymenobacter arizonensis TaxID=1227077 RepID=A0A1I5Z9Z1_HYMAR|nr:hypothetical protein [Hymenobacter arizonensis]SFQ53263.1 hypothetical protein SAMN04515668_2863 [Hymenobacter arizonensis]